MGPNQRRQRDHKIAVTSSAAQAESGRAVPWLIASLAGGAGVAIAGWLLVTGATIVGWVAAPGTTFGAAIRFGTQLWLLANGGGLATDGIELSVVPLGLTAVIVVLASGAAGWAIQQAIRGRSGAARSRAGWRVVAVFTLTYLVAIALAVFLTSSTLMVWRALLSAVLVAGLSACWALVQAGVWDPMASWPVWAKAVPRAVAGALLVMVAGGALLLVIALLLSGDSVVAVHDALAPGPAGSILVLLIQLVYLPNFIGWCASWSVGAGFSIGVGTVISPSQTDVGLLPALPVLGAIGENGPGSWAALSWLGVGVVAGAVAAVIVVLARPRARADETALVGGASGGLAGIVLAAVLALTNGAFGVQRLIEIGVRVNDLIVLAPTLLGLSGLVVGLIVGLLRRERSGVSEDSVEAPDDSAAAEDTSINPHRFGDAPSEPLL